jgi:hypothetical protein
MLDKVRSNNLILQKNISKINLIHINYPTSKKRDRIVNAINERNSELSKETKTLLSLHDFLFRFAKENKELINKSIRLKLKKNEILNDVWSNYRKACLRKTLSGEMKIQSTHPFIRDKKFTDDLMMQCQHLELYEKCSEILRVQEVVKNNS